MSRSPGESNSRTAPAVATRRSLDDAFDALADRRRRVVLSTLRNRDGPVAESDLAAAVVARVEATSRDEVSDRDRQRAATQLHHVHLPKLQAAGMVRCDADRRTVTSASHAVFGRPEFDALRRANVGSDFSTLGAPEAVDEVLSALADARRRTVLSVLREQGRLELSTLAERVAERETVADPTDEEVESVRVGLHHVHAPTLADAGLVNYDRIGRTLAAADHPAFDERWLRVPTIRTE